MSFVRFGLVVISCCFSINLMASDFGGSVSSPTWQTLPDYREGHKATQEETLAIHEALIIAFNQLKYEKNTCGGFTLPTSVTSEELVNTWLQNSTIEFFVLNSATPLIVVRYNLFKFNSGATPQNRQRVVDFLYFTNHERTQITHLYRSKYDLTTSRRNKGTIDKPAFVDEVLVEHDEVTCFPAK